MKEENNDKNTNVSELIQKFIKFRDERDWAKFHSPTQLALSLNLESSEVLELFQWKEGITWDDLKENSELLTDLKDELADVVRCVAHICDLADIDLTSACFEKNVKAAKKYPVEKCFGKCHKYSKYIE